MILFKRVGESFRQIEGREWALLALETLGVLAGILIAFELQEWASRRSEAARKRNQLERLLTEAEDNVASLRGQRELLGGWAKNERLFAATLVHDRKCPPPEQWDAVEHMTRYAAFDVAQGVYRELLGAGGLSTIENPYIRNRISDFHDLLEFYDNQNDFFRQKMVRPVSDGDPRVTVNFDPRAEDPISWSFDHAALCADHAFRNRVATGARNHWVLAVTARADMTDYAIKMCAAMAHELGKTCVPHFGGPLAGSDAATAAKAIDEMKATKTD
jgi:hypothetical protein